MTQSKILKVAVPTLRCYPHHANLFSTICNNDYDRIMMATNYIQLAYNTIIDRIDYNYGFDILEYYKSYPFTENQCYSRKMITKKWKNNCEFIKDCIDHDGYICLLIDRFYISAYKNQYYKAHDTHDIMIYGYDDTYKSFYTADCFLNGVYSFEKVTYDEMEDATLSQDEYDWLEGIHVWNVRENMYTGMAYDIDRIKKLLNDFVMGEATQAITITEDIRRNIDNFKYGIDVYDAVKNYLESRIGKGYIDRRIAFILVEHIQFLVILCDELNRYANLKNYNNNKSNLLNIAKKMQIVKNLFLKYNANNNIQYLKNCIVVLDEIKKLQSNALKELINDVHKTDTIAYFEPKQNLDKIRYSFDNNTKGNWKGIYGNKGFDIVGDLRRLPSNIDESEYIIRKGIYVSVFRDKGDVRALERYDDDTKRPVAYLLNDEFTIKMKILSLCKVSLYFVDYDNSGRVLQIELRDIDNDEIEQVVKLENYGEGIYITFEIEGNYIFKISKLCGADAALSGIFWD